MTIQILLSAVALLAILVCISSALESQDESLIATDPVSREARDAETQGERKKGPEKKKLGERKKNKKKEKSQKKIEKSDI